MSGAYYNEFDPYAAEWLRNLVAAGLLPAGDVDERSIVDVRGDDLQGYGACHFFAGIGGWPYALRLAGVPDEWPVWTGSCPCQPFSVAGAGAGTSDERHLWPEFRRLITECRPQLVFGEQVDSADGQLWLAGVHLDLEAEAYAFGAAVLPAAGVGAPHIRQRLFWVADATSRRLGTDRRAPGEAGHADLSGQVGRLADAAGARRAGGTGEAGTGAGELSVISGGAGGLGDAERTGCEVARNREPDLLAHREGQANQPWGAGGGFWREAILIPCGDGKARRIKPGIQPLAHGVPARVGRLRAYGNAIVPQVAAEFVKAAMEVTR